MVAKKTTKKYSRIKNKSKQIVLFLLLISSPLWMYLVYYFFKEIKAGYIKYQAFGIYIPKKYSVHGIDVSKYQNIINWKSVKKMNVERVNVDFAFIKATEGTRLVDSNFPQNWIRIKNAEIPRGAYHFFLPHKDAALQANHFCKLVRLSKGDLPPVVDIETENGMSSEKIRKSLKIFLRKVEKFYEMKPIIYSNANFYQQHLAGYFDSYPVWIAHYSNENAPKIDKEWAFWQISETAQVNGINSKVDFNVFRGSEKEFNELRKK